MKMPYEDCPSFEKCSCQKCPLDPDIDKRAVLEGEDKCRAHKPTRLRIGAKYPGLLPMGGLNSREFRNKARWEAKSPAERALIVGRLENALKTRRNGPSREAPAMERRVA